RRDPALARVLEDARRPRPRVAARRTPARRRLTRRAQTREWTPNATAAYVLARRRSTRRAQTRSGRSAYGHQPTARPRSSRVSSADHPSVPIAAENPFT